jgi:hypothetical protein
MARYATYALITLRAIGACRASDGHQVVAGLAVLVKPIEPRALLDST